MIEKVSRLSFEETIGWIKSHKSGVVLCCTLNEIMMANEKMDVRWAMERADLLTPDGMPLVWYLRWKYGKGERVYGPEILGEFTKNKSTISKTKQFFIGDKKNKKYFSKFGEYLVLSYKEKFEESDYKNIANRINKSGAKIVWVGLGAEKQINMADELRKRVPGKVYITVGAAFDFLSGNKRQAPRWMQISGLEWLYRIISEPKRLGKRYLKIIYFNGINVFRQIARWR